MQVSPLDDRTLGWATDTAPTTDGISIFLPPEVELFEAGLPARNISQAVLVGPFDDNDLDDTLENAGKALATFPICSEADRDLPTNKALEVAPPGERSTWCDSRHTKLILP